MGYTHKQLQTTAIIHFMTIIIAVVAFVVAFFVLSWNKRLKIIINSRTEELRRSNDSLTYSNRQLAVVNEELKNHDKLQKEFINIAAHELRTPIQPILTLTEVLRSKIKDTEQLAMLDAAIRNAKRLRRLTENILDITRIEGKSLQLEKEQFNLYEVILNVMLHNYIAEYFFKICIRHMRNITIILFHILHSQMF
jgi:signal transduction histidine kinase